MAPVPLCGAPPLPHCNQKQLRDKTVKLIKGSARGLLVRVWGGRRVRTYAQKARGALPPHTRPRNRKATRPAKEKETAHENERAPNEHQSNRSKPGMNPNASSVGRSAALFVGSLFRSLLALVLVSTPITLSLSLMPSRRRRSTTRAASIMPASLFRATHTPYLNNNI